MDEAISADGLIDRYCVIGNPIAHSMSPLIHKAFATQTQQKISYQAVLTEKVDFPTTIEQFYRQGMKGMNITIPFKMDAWEITDQYSPDAKLAMAVNTISFDKSGGIIGDNTDGVGFIRDLMINHNTLIKGKDILILGAGGAVRGILRPILDEQPDKVVIANRTVSRAKQLVRDFNIVDVSVCGFDELPERCFDIVINATSASLYGKQLPLSANLIKDDTCCYDLVYAKQNTTFGIWAKQNGATKVVDGLGMLVEQAAESFFIWRNIRPDTSRVIKQLRKEL